MMEEGERPGTIPCRGAARAPNLLRHEGPVHFLFLF